MLIFNAEEHKYTNDGVVIPSVTEVIRFLSVDVIANANKELRNASAERGTRIHEACTAYDFDPQCEVDGDIAGYVQAYADFKRDYKIGDWELFEAMFGNEYFAGTLDRFGEIDGIPTVLDIKTGSKLNMKVHGVQLSAYSELLLEHGHVVLQGAILHLKKNGAYTLNTIDCVNLFDLYPVFQKCLYLHNYLKGGM